MATTKKDITNTCKNINLPSAEWDFGVLVGLSGGGGGGVVGGDGGSSMVMDGGGLGGGGGLPDGNPC